MAKVTAKRCIEYFSTQTTIHGVLFFGALKLHLIERFEYYNTHNCYIVVILFTFVDYSG